MDVGKKGVVRFVLFLFLLFMTPFGGGGKGLGGKKGEEVGKRKGV